MRSSTSIRWGSEGVMYSAMALLSMLGFLVAVTKKPIPKTRIGYRVGDHENNICLTWRSSPPGDVATWATRRHPLPVVAAVAVSPRGKPLNQHVPPCSSAVRQAPQHSDSDRANQEQREDSMPTKTLHRLLPTSWLAQRLNISVTTIERLRAQQSPDLPPHVSIGKSIRYDERVVEAWLLAKMGHPAPLPTDVPAVG